MYFDALTTAAVADECRALVGGRIQEILQVVGQVPGHFVAFADDAVEREGGDEGDLHRK